MITTEGFTDGTNVSIKIASTDYKDHLKSARFEPEDTDAKFVTFAKAAEGDTGVWKFKGTAFQSFKTAAFWKYVWSNSGSQVEVTLAPYGNAVPSATEPHYEATAVIGKKPPIGGDAKSEFEFEVDWELTGTPVEVTA